MYILILEDSPRTAQFYAHLLVSEGFEVETVASIAQARDAIDARPPDILLMDRMLPDGDGGQLCLEMKREAATAAVFVILISGARTRESDQVEGLRVGADDYLLKPISAELLVARVRNAVRIKRAQAELWSANQALYSSEERFRTTFEQVAVGMCHIAPDGRFLRVNSWLCETLGYSQEELLGSTEKRITYTEDRVAAAQKMQLLLRGDVSSFGMEKRYVCADGSLVWTQFTASLLTNLDGAPQYVVAVIRDISARKEAENRLRRSEEAFRALVENTPDMVARFDREARFVYVNRQSLHVLDRTPEELIGQTLDQAGLLPEIQALCIAAINEAFDSKESVRIEFTLPVRNETRSFETTLVPEFSEGDTVATVLAVSRDITRRVEMEMENRRLFTVVDQAAEGVIITDADFHILYANPYVQQITGYSWDELRGRETQIFRSGKHPPDFYAEMEEAIRRGETWRGVLINKRKDDSLYHESLTMFPVLDQYGRVVNYASVRRDVSQDVQTQRQREAMISLAAGLRQTDSRDEMLEIIVDQVQQFMQAESTAISLIDEASGSADTVAIHGSFASLPASGGDPFHEANQFVIATGEAYLSNSPDDENQLVVQGEDSPISAIAGVPLIVQHRLIGVLWIGRSTRIEQSDLTVLSAMGDIAASTIYRADLYARSLEYAAELERRVAKRTEQLEQANAELRVLDEMKSKFVSDVSHELRTPLASLELYLDLLFNGKPEKRDQYKDSIRDMMQRLTHLVEEILDVSLLSIKTDRPHTFYPVDINSLVEQLLEVFGHRSNTANISLSSQLHPSLPMVLGDGTQLSRVVSNLLANAVNYTPYGSVSVQTGLASGQVSLVIQDTGIGISAQDLPYIMDRFYRGSQDGLNISGTGLGLSIVKEILDLHDGHINIQSAVGEGTTVTVTLPVAANGFHHASALDVTAV